MQTVTVPAGGAVITELKLDVPGNYILVDHALSRLERGLAGILHVEGAPNPEIFDGKVEPETATDVGQFCARALFARCSATRMPARSSLDLRLVVQNGIQQ